MSAFIASKTHINALLTAGLAPNHGCTLRWFAPEEPQPGDYERGEFTGPTALESYERRRRELRYETADAVGTMLLAENYRSVNHRYDENADDTPGLHRFRELPGRVDPVTILKAINCYEYQSCEHPGWEKSEARAAKSTK